MEKLLNIQSQVAVPLSAVGFLAVPARLRGLFMKGRKMYDTVTRKSRVYFSLWYNVRQAKKKRESRLSYRLKKWFLSLRPVNNYLWRRGNKKLYDNHAFNYALKAITLGFYSGYFRDGMEAQNTAILPDYPSIRELSTERKE
jgi:hypothetical protein